MPKFNCLRYVILTLYHCCDIVFEKKQIIKLENHKTQAPTTKDPGGWVKQHTATLIFRYRNFRRQKPSHHLLPGVLAVGLDRLPPGPLAVWLDSLPTGPLAVGCDGGGRRRLRALTWISFLPPGSLSVGCVTLPPGALAVGKRVKS